MKTPEEMAEEWQKDWWGPYQADSNLQLATRVAFVHGYQAAKDSLMSKGLQNYIAEKTSDAWCTAMQIGEQAKWISVKERLPVFRQYNQNDESGYTEDVLMCFVWGRIRILNFKKVDGIVTTGYGNHLIEVTHWMPLPEAPKEEK